MQFIHITQECLFLLFFIILDSKIQNTLSCVELIFLELYNNILQNMYLYTCI